MEVARTLSSQKPDESESCLSLFILVSLLATSKKPPQDQYTVSHILQIFCCHAAKIRDIFKLQNQQPLYGYNTNFDWSFNEKLNYSFQRQVAYLTKKVAEKPLF